MTLLFINKFTVSDFSTLFFFFPTCHALKTWFGLSRVKLYSSSREVRVTEGKITVVVRVNARFELSGVNCGDHVYQGRVVQSWVKTTQG